MRFLVGENGKLPTRGSHGAAGLDLYAAHDQVVAGWSRALVGLDISCEMPRGMVALIRDRSGLAVREGIVTMAGVIDCDYRGEWKVALFNTTHASYRVEKGERIAQAVIVPYWSGNSIEVERLEETGRGDGGFGSTGR